MVSGSSILVASKEQVSCDFNGESVILNLKNDSYYGLNEVGTFVWDMIKEPKTVSQIKDGILAKYEVDPNECERDLLELVNDLLANELVQVSEEANNQVSRPFFAGERSSDQSTYPALCGSSRTVDLAVPRYE